VVFLLSGERVSAGEHLPQVQYLRRPEISFLGTIFTGKALPLGTKCILETCAYISWNVFV